MCLYPNHGFPCGRCIECLSRKRNDWSIRLQFQLNSMDKDKLAFFTTLTYKNECLHLVKHGDVVFANLSKTDFQSFMKRLRRYVEYHYNVKNLKFYACGEYGPRTYRPHMHLIMFNFPKMPLNQVQEILQKSWNYGEVRRTSLLKESRCHYATKYMIFEDFIPDCPGIELPFKLMSNGLGHCLAEFDAEFKNRFYGGENPEDVFITALEFLENMKKPFNSMATLEYMEKSPNFDRDAYEYVINSCRDYIVLRGRKFCIPRYIRNKIFPKEVREVLNLAKKFEVQERQMKYHEQWFEYDLEQQRNNKPPYWMQLSREKYERVKNSFNKKYKKDITLEKNLS